MLPATLASRVEDTQLPALIAQLNTTDAAARRAARDAGLPTGGVVPKDRYDAALRAEHGVQEATSDSFREADVANVALAKDVAFIASQRCVHGHRNAHAAALEHTVHVGVLYAPCFTRGKPTGAGTLKASACLVSEDLAYAKGFDHLPKPDGLDAAMAQDATTFQTGNQIFLLNLRPSNASRAGAALGHFLSRQRLFSIAVSGPEQGSIEGVDVGCVVQQTFAQAFRFAYGDR